MRALAAIIALTMLSGPALGLGMCGTRSDFVKALNDKYQESRKSIGIAGEVNVVELFTSKTGTWTILVTTEGGKACIIAAGKGWENIPEETPGQNL